MPLPFIAALLAGAASSAAAVGTAVTAAGAAAAGAAASAGAAVAGAATALGAGVAVAGSTSAALTALVATVTISSGMLALIGAAAALFAFGFTIHHLKKLQEARSRGFKDGQAAASKEYEEKFRRQGREFAKKISEAERIANIAFTEKEKLMEREYYELGFLEGYCDKNNIKDVELITFIKEKSKFIEDFEARVKANNS